MTTGGAPDPIGQGGSIRVQGGGGMEEGARNGGGGRGALASSTGVARTRSKGEEWEEALNGKGRRRVGQSNRNRKEEHNHPGDEGGRSEETGRTPHNEGEMGTHNV